MNIVKFGSTACTSDTVTSKSTTSKSAPAARDEKGTTVALSPSTQLLYDGNNDVDVARVQAIRDALADGTFVIDTERVAQALINSAVELIK